MKYRNTWHVLHFILTLLFLPWALVWILRIMMNSQYNASLDRYRAHEDMEKLRKAVEGRKDGWS